MAVLIGGVAVVALVVLVIVAAMRRRGSSDDIATFRRQIDALSHEARRPTIDRMKPQNESATDDDGDDGL